jgi:CubicO group peptidase (beta-lactamase class C family)
MTQTSPRRRRSTAVVLAVVAAFCTSPPVEVAGQQTALDSLITAYMADQHIAGLAAAAVDSGRVVWIGTYGMANVEEQIPVTEHAPFMIASVSKTVTATVLMSLHADGRFALDDDINDYLPFSVRNPNHPTVPITFRQLMRHRSSLADNGVFYRPHWSQANGDPTTRLGEYLQAYLSPDGEDYDAARNFRDDPPDAVFRYCNTCYALLGYLAERISGMPFEQLSAEALFEPLEMTDTAWFLRDLEGRDLVMPYRHAADSGFVAYGQNGYPDWPAGQLRTSIHDLSRFLAVHLSNGVYEGETVIDPSTIEALTPRNAHVGFHTWFQSAIGGDVVYSHGGGDIGVVTDIVARRASGRGVIVLTNGESRISPIVEAVYLAIDELRGGEPPQ